MGLLSKLFHQSKTNKGNNTTQQMTYHALNMNFDYLNDMQIQYSLGYNERPDEPDYGYSESNPIVTMNNAGSIDYLSRLRTNENEPVSWKHNRKHLITSIEGINEVMADVYQLTQDNKEIYICPYGNRNAHFAPQGMKLQYSLQQAIDVMSEKMLSIAKACNILGKTESVHMIPELEKCNDFTRKIYTAYRVHHLSQDPKEIWIKTIYSSFYGSAYLSRAYYNNSNEIKGCVTYDYLTQHVGLEDLENETYKTMGIENNERNKNRCHKMIKSFTDYTIKIIDGIELIEDTERAVLEASKCAYTLGMLLIKRIHQDENKSSLDAAYDKLLESENEYQYHKPEDMHIHCAYIPPTYETYEFSCSCCGKKSCITEVEKDYKGESMHEKYNDIAKEFTKLGYPASVKAFCDNCIRQYPFSLARMFYGKGEYVHSFVFFITRPDYEDPIYSFPIARTYFDEPYRVALAFLNGADTYRKLSEATRTYLPASEYTKYIQTVLFAQKGKSWLA